MRYSLLILLLFCLSFNKSYAQQTLKGFVFENNSRVPLAGIHIENTRTKLKTETDIKGHFSIDARVNDVLIFQGYAYLPDTLLLIDLKAREVFLEPAKNMLKQVDIYNQEVHVGTMMDPEFHGQSAIYQRNADGSYKGGVAFRVWSNHSAERKLKKLQKAQHDEEIRLQIDKVFSAPNLLKYLPLKPEELSSFKSRYIPTVKTYTANDFNLLAYLNTCYKQFIKLSPEKRLADKLAN